MTTVGEQISFVSDLLKGQPDTEDQALKRTLSKLQSLAETDPDGTKRRALTPQEYGGMPQIVANHVVTRIVETNQNDTCPITKYDSGVNTEEVSQHLDHNNSVNSKKSGTRIDLTPNLSTFSSDVGARERKANSRARLGTAPKEAKPD